MILTPLIYILLIREPEQMGSIRYLDKPACIQCKHYVPDINDISGKCRMFGGKDLQTGQILYHDANSVRQDESKCTVHGNYFVGKTRVQKLGYRMQKNIPYLFSIVCVAGLYSLYDKMILFNCAPIATL
jgi:hypothetical protein